MDKPIITVDNKKEINHIDGDKQNNHYLNLEWVTSTENKLHSYKNGLASHVGIKNTQSKLSELEVLEIRNSQLDRISLSNLYGVSKSHIDRILRRENWTHI